MDGFYVTEYEISQKPVLNEHGRAGWIVTGYFEKGNGKIPVENIAKAISNVPGRRTYQSYTVDIYGNRLTFEIRTEIE